MTATGSSREARHDDWLVAIVGLSRPFGSSSRALLERCGLTVLDLRSPDEAVRVLSTIAPDAIVVDSHHPALNPPSSVYAKLLRSIETIRATRPTAPLIVLTSTGLSVDTAEDWHRTGAVFLPSHKQTYRQVAALARSLCGLPAGCCPVERSSPGLTMTKSRRYAVVTRPE
jgi:hypothetical protein